MYTEQEQYPQVDTTKVYLLGSDPIYLTNDGTGFIYKVAYDLGAEGHVMTLEPVVKRVLTLAPADNEN